MTTHAFKWNEPGSPGLLNVAGSLIAVLDYCLIAAGFTKVFSGTNKAAYRAGAGEERCFLRVDDTDPNFATINLYDWMTNVDTGTGQLPNTSLTFTTGTYSRYFVVAKMSSRYVSSTLTAPNYIPWSLYTDGKFFILRIQFSNPGALGDSQWGESVFNNAKSSYVGSGPAEGGGRSYIFGEYVPTGAGYRHSVIGGYVDDAATYGGTYGHGLTYNTPYLPGGAYGTEQFAHWADGTDSPSTDGYTQALAVNGHPSAPATPMICSCAYQCMSDFYGVFNNIGWLTTDVVRSGIQPLSRLLLVSPAPILTNTTPTGIYQAPLGYLPGVWVGPTGMSSPYAADARYFSGDVFSGDPASPLAGRTFEVKEQDGLGRKIFFIETSNTWGT